MIHTCPICLTMYEDGDDHLREPCAPCYRSGWRTDACGNIASEPHRINSTAGNDMNNSRS